MLELVQEHVAELIPVKANSLLHAQLLDDIPASSVAESKAIVM
jgi:hypothetical protein